MRIVVVGAGVTGCAVAFECARRGADVQVVDPRRPGCGATFASAGMLAPYVEGHDPALRTLGVSSLSRYEPFLARVAAVTSRWPDWERCGTMQVAFDDEAEQALAQLAAQLAEWDVGHELLGGPAARLIEPRLSARVVAALEIPIHGDVAATGLVDALVDAAASLGVTFVEGRVVDLAPAMAGVRVVTESGAVDADAVVLAAGSWSSSFCLRGRADASTPSVRPVRGQLLYLRLPERPAGRVLWGPRCYVVPRRDGTVLVGATVEDVGFDERATLGGVRTLSAAAVEVLPALESAELQEIRVGLRPATADELPIVGPSATMPGVFHAFGHYRNGVLLAPLTAQLVADLVLDGESGSELELTRPSRFGL